MKDKKVLALSFDPQTIEHLGVKMYSNIPNALAELIANSYDADSPTVHIKLLDDGTKKSIIVEDEGVGMDFNEINEKFLRIGRNRRDKESLKSPSGTRTITGKKGLGKLAFFGIGDVIEIITIKERSGQKVSFTLKWKDLINTKDAEYEPKFKIAKCGASEKGTKIILKELKRKSPFDMEGLAISISKLFNFFDETFKVDVSLNDDDPIIIDDKLKYKHIDVQFEWKFPAFCKRVKSKYSEKNNIKGKVYSTDTPLRAGLRGITLFGNGRLLNAPELFDVSESSHGFSYLTGWLEVDFIDNLKKDVIATARQSLNWDLEETIELRKFLRKTVSELERQWRVERNEIRKKRIKEKTKIDPELWYRNLPEKIKILIEPMVNMITERSELGDLEQSDVVQNLHTLVPEFPYYHWRDFHWYNLQPDIQKVVHEYYKNEDYYTAVLEGVKRYLNELKSKSGVNLKERNLIENVFNLSKPKLSVTEKFKKPNGDLFEEETLTNITEGHRMLAIAMWQACRNPIAHEEVIDLKLSGLFSEDDCLDALSLLSHLFRRLDNAELTSL